MEKIKVEAVKYSGQYTRPDQGWHASVARAGGRRPDDLSFLTRTFNAGVSYKINKLCPNYRCLLLNMFISQTCSEAGLPSKVWTIQILYKT